MVALIKPKAKPDPDALYEVVESFAAGHKVYQTGFRMRGDDPAVRAYFGRFMPADLDDPAKRKARIAYWDEANAEAAADAPQRPPPPLARRPSGRMRAVRYWTVDDPALAPRKRINAGELVSVDDPVYTAYPHLFEVLVEER